MSRTTHSVSENCFVLGAHGTRYAFRRFGNVGGVPLIFLAHFRAAMDHWDPDLTDAVAAEREVILVDNDGVGLSNGSTPKTISEMAEDILSFIQALDLPLIDLLGFCIGGFVAQELALRKPALVRKIVLAGTGPKGGPDMHGWRDDVHEAAHKPILGADEILFILFKATETSQKAGRDYLARVQRRQTERDDVFALASAASQYDAILEWGTPNHDLLARLSAIQCPTFVATGDGDLVIPPRLTYLMGALIPAAEVKVYPDAAHGFLFQHNSEFAADVNRFLDV